MNEEKERKYMEVMDNKDKLRIDFKDWYMEHSIEWMDGFNQACRMLLKLIEER